MIRRDVYLLCDGDAPDCAITSRETDEPIDAANAREARTGAAAHGWITRGGRDYCPACAGNNEREK